MLHLNQHFRPDKNDDDARPRGGRHPAMPRLRRRKHARGPHAVPDRIRPQRSVARGSSQLQVPVRRPAADPERPADADRARPAGTDRRSAISGIAERSGATVTIIQERDMKE